MVGTFFPVKRALNAHQGFVADMKIYFRGFRITVSKKSLNVLPFYALFHQMGCKAMAQTVRGCCLRKFSISYCPPHDLFQSTDCQVITGKFIWKQDATGTTFLKSVLCKDIQTTLRENGIAVHPVFRIPDMDLHI